MSGGLEHDERGVCVSVSADGDLLVAGRQEQVAGDRSHAMICPSSVDLSDLRKPSPLLFSATGPSAPLNHAGVADQSHQQAFPTSSISCNACAGSQEAPVDTAAITLPTRLNSPPPAVSSLDTVVPASSLEDAVSSRASTVPPAARVTSPAASEHHQLDHNNNPLQRQSWVQHAFLLSAPTPSIHRDSIYSTRSRVTSWLPVEPLPIDLVIPPATEPPPPVQMTKSVPAGSVDHVEQLAHLLPHTGHTVGSNGSNGSNGPNGQVDPDPLDQDDQDAIGLDLTAVQTDTWCFETPHQASVQLEPYDGTLDGSETAVPSPAMLVTPTSVKGLDQHAFGGVKAEHDTESFYEPQPAKLTWYLAFSAFTASLGMFLFGYHISELSASQFILTCSSIDLASLETPRNPSFNLPWCIPMSATLDFAIISSMLSVGGLFGSAGSAALTRFIGRKGVLAFAATIQVVSPVVMASSVGYTPILVGRLLAGIGAGAAASVNAAYLSDIAPDAWRGIFGSLTQVMLNLGLLFCAIMNIFFASIDSWRVVLIASVIPALLQLMCVPWIATSPRDVASWYPLAPLEPDAPPEALEADPVVHLLRRLWGQDVDDAVLISASARLRPLPLPPKKVQEDTYYPRMGTETDGSISGRTLIGSSSVGRLRGDGRQGDCTPAAGSISRAEKRMSTMSTASARSRRRRSMVKRPVAKPATVWEFISTKRYRCPLGILSLAHFSLQASGITLYFSYSHSILTLLFTPDTAKVVFALSIAYHVLLILLCGRLLDTHGRRPLFLAAYTVMGISAFLLNTASILRIHWLALGAFFGAVTGFALGMGNVPYVLISEVVDGRAVASAAAVSLTVNWTTQGLYLVAFLPLLAIIKSWVFVLIGSITLAAGWAAYLWVPETWGRTGAQVLEEMNDRPRKEWSGIRVHKDDTKEQAEEERSDVAEVPSFDVGHAQEVDGDESPSDTSALHGDPTSYGTDLPLQPATTDLHALPPLPQPYACFQNAPATANNFVDAALMHHDSHRLSAPPTHQLYSLSAFARTASTDQLSVTETTSTTSNGQDFDEADGSAHSREEDEEQATSLPGSELTSRAVTPVVFVVIAAPPLPPAPAPESSVLARQQLVGGLNGWAAAHNATRAKNRATLVYPGQVGSAIQGLVQIQGKPEKVGGGTGLADAARERTRTI